MTPAADLWNELGIQHPTSVLRKSLACSDLFFEDEHLLYFARAHMSLSASRPIPGQAR